MKTFRGMYCYYITVYCLLHYRHGKTMKGSFNFPLVLVFTDYHYLQISSSPKGMY